MLLIIMAGGHSAHAQLSWKVIPNSQAYRSISFLGPNIIKVTDRYGGMGLLDTNGQQLLKCDYDTIFPVYQGVAVIAKQKENETDGHYYVAGVVNTQTGRVTPFKYADRYSVMTDQDAQPCPFYSEGYLVVIDRKTMKKGYLDISGRVLGGNETSDLNLDLAYPFAGGYALAGRGKERFYIDKNYKSFRVSEGSKWLVPETNFSEDGKAVVKDSKEQYLLQKKDLVNQALSSKTNITSYQVDYLNRYCKPGLNPQTDVEWDKNHFPAHRNAGLPKAENGLYGYKVGGSSGLWALPPQFKSAQPFVEAYALAQLQNGDWVILDCTYGMSVDCGTVKPTSTTVYVQDYFEETAFSFKADKTNYDYKVYPVQNAGTPDFRSPLHVEKQVPGGEYTFHYKTAARNAGQGFLVVIEKDEVQISQQALNYQCKSLLMPEIDGVDWGNATASKPHDVPVYIKLYNYNELPIEVSYKLSGSEGFYANPPQGKIKIPAKSPSRLEGYFYVKEKTGATVSLILGDEAKPRTWEQIIYPYVKSKSSSARKTSSTKTKTKPKDAATKDDGGKKIKDFGGDSKGSKTKVIKNF